MPSTLAPAGTGTVFSCAGPRDGNSSSTAAQRKGRMVGRGAIIVQQTSPARPSSNTRMKLVIGGGSGFLGTALAWAWAEEGHDVRILTRALAAGQAQHESGTGKPGITRVGWTPDGRAGSLPCELERAEAVINLAGESIAAGRWTAARKQAL